jgi:CTP synthase (UTP-ammonia lyase)
LNQERRNNDMQGTALRAAAMPDRVSILRSGPLRIVGSHAEGEVRVVELPSHPFFVGTLYVPQAQSTPTAPHALVSAFLQGVAAGAA